MRATTMAFAVLAACGHGAESARVPEALEIVGTYDLTVSHPAPGEPSAGVGSIAVDDDDGTIYAQLSHPPVVLHGTLAPDGGVTLEGVNAHSDVILGVSATGSAVARDGVFRIALTVHGWSSAGVDVVLERPFDADLSKAAGRFRLDFPAGTGCACTAPLEILTPIDRTGVAAVVAMDDRPDGARLSFASVDVAPSGRFHLDAAYETPEGSRPVGIDGPPFVLLIDGWWPIGPVGSVGAGRYRILSGLRMEIESRDLTITRIE